MVPVNGGKIMMRFLRPLLAVVALLAFSTPSAAEKPPAGSKPLSEVAAAVERAGFTPIVEASLDAGLWEVEAYQANTKYELRVDPKTGEIKSKRVDD